MVQKGGQALQYDPENRLIQVKVNDATLAQFIYDGDGGRVKNITPDGETIYIGSLYEQRYNAITQERNNVKSIFLGQNRICQVEGDEVYYYHQDHIGSSNVITDNQGAQVALYEYKPYGENSKIDGSFSIDIRFTGKRLDTSTGLYYYGARYYDPELGRFIQPDSIVPNPVNPQDLNRYSYCSNNPINYVDPTGHGWFKKFFGKIVGAIVGTIIGIATGNPALGIAAYSAISGGISAYQAGASFGKALGIGAISGAFAFMGGQIGSAFGSAIGGGKFGSMLWGAVGAGTFGGASAYAMAGGDPWRGALVGAASGFTAGLFMAAGFELPGFVLGGGVGAEVAGGSFGRGCLEGLAGFYAYSLMSSIMTSAGMRSGSRMKSSVGRVRDNLGVNKARTIRLAENIDPNDGEFVVDQDGKVYFIPKYDPDKATLGEKIIYFLYKRWFDKVTPPFFPNPLPPPGQGEPKEVARTYGIYGK